MVQIVTPDGGLMGFQGREAEQIQFDSNSVVSATAQTLDNKGIELKLSGGDKVS